MTHRPPAVRGSGAASFAAAQQALFRFASLSSLFRRSRALLNPPDFSGRACRSVSPASPSSRQSFSRITPSLSSILRTGLFGLGVTLLGASSAWAADIYVDGAYGNDWNDGSRWS